MILEVVSSIASSKYLNVIFFYAALYVRGMFELRRFLKILNLLEMTFNDFSSDPVMNWQPYSQEDMVIEDGCMDGFLVECDMILTMLSQ